MEGNVHAVLLLLFASVAVGSVVTLKRRWPTGREVVIALALASFGTFLAPSCNHHMCHSGEPRHQWIILGPCLLLVLLLVRSARLRKVLGIIVFTGMIGLSCHFTSLVHEPGWTGNTEPDRITRGFFLHCQKTAKSVAEESKHPDEILPAGWLRDTAFWKEMEEHSGPMRLWADRAATGVAHAADGALSVFGGGSGCLVFRRANQRCARKNGVAGSGMARGGKCRAVAD